MLNNRCRLHDVFCGQIMVPFWINRLSGRRISMELCRICCRIIWALIGCYSSCIYLYNQGAPTVFQDSIYHPKKHCHHWLEGTGTERKIQTHVNPPAILDKDSIHGCFERCSLQMAQHVKSSIIQRVGHCVRWDLFSLKHISCLRIGLCGENKSKIDQPQRTMCQKLSDW